MLPHRLLSKIRVDAETGCWVFNGTITANGYGRAWDGSRSDWAHRVYYRLSGGNIPAGYQIDHLCRNTKCVNPAHLEAVEPAENHRRSTNSEITRKRHKERTHCKRGHPLFGANVRLDRRGARVCRECSRLHSARFKTANPTKQSEYSRRSYERRKADILLEIANGEGT